MTWLRDLPKTAAQTLVSAISGIPRMALYLIQDKDGRPVLDGDYLDPTPNLWKPVERGVIISVVWKSQGKTGCFRCNDGSVVRFHIPPAASGIGLITLPITCL